MKLRIFLIQLFFLTIVFSRSFSDGNVWNNFLDDPNEGNYNICKQQVRDSLSGKYEQYNSPSFLQLMENGSIGKILTLVENGNEYASDLCFQFYPLFVGYPNYLERFDISLGKLIKKNPKLFLKLLSNHLSKRTTKFFDVESILTNYGDEFVDELEKRILESEERIRSLQEVQEKDYENIKNRCIEVLVRHIELVNRIKEKY